MDKRTLTDKQATALGTIQHYIALYHIPPTYKELSEIMGIRPNAVRGRLLVLESLGHLELIPNIARGIVVL